MAAQPAASGANMRSIAPAPTTSGVPTLPTAANEQTMPYTCVTCAKRKVKCDKVHPVCATCRKGRLECAYEAPPPRKRKRKQVDDVHEKLELAERLLESHGIRVPEDAGLSYKSTPSSVPTVKIQTESTPSTSPADPDELPTNTGKFLAGSGKSRYIDSSLWRNLGEVSGEPFAPSDDEEEDPPGEQVSPWYAPASDLVSASLLGPGSPNVSLLDLHPTYDNAIKIWKAYCSNVDPILKITHIPTGLEMVQRAAANPSSISRSTECFLFAIYHFGVFSMTNAECQELLGQPRDVLQPRYHEATRQALVNASFLRTTELAVVQGFMLFLFSSRNLYDAHTFWILTGVCVRIAQRMGLHRDGEQLGLGPFDVQIRRRIYWQLLPLDGLAAQMCGTGINSPAGGFDTKPPSNVNDADLSPNMTETPVERRGATDMLFILVRAEVGRFHQRMKPWTGEWGRLWQAKDASAADEIERAIDDLENTIEEKFLRYIDFVVPIHCLAQAMARTALCAGRFRLRLPLTKRSSSGADADKRKQELFELAIRVVDYDIAAHSNPALKRFEWHLQGLFQWEAMIWIVECLRENYPFIDAQMTWARIAEIYRCHPPFLSKRALHIALGKLTLRAWDAQPPERREASKEPAFIQNLRKRFGKTEPPKQEPPPPTYNPFYVETDGNADLPLPDTSFNMPGLSTGMDFNLLNGFNPDTMDWMYWDQLIKDQQNTFQ